MFLLRIWRNDMISQSRKSEKAERNRLLLLLGIAALIRALYLYIYSRQPIWGELVVDSLFHSNWADRIAAGDWLGSETFFRSPLYIYVLGVLRSLAPESLLLPRIYGAALGLVSIALTYRITRVCVSGKRGEAAALGAAALQALYPAVLFFEAELLVDFQFVTLLQAALYTLLRIRADDPGKTRRIALCGFLLALAALTRATALALVPLFILYIWRDHGSPGNRSGLIKPLLAFALGLGLTIAPVTVRNYLVSGDLTLIASSGGINFYIGNHAGADPTSASLPEPLGGNWTIADVRGEAMRLAGRELSDSEVSASWRDRALNWIAEHPLDFARHYAHKIYLLLANRPYSNNRPLGSVYAGNPLLRFSPLNFALLLSLATLGILWRKPEDKRLARVASVAGIYALVVALFFVNERFRLPSLTLLFPAAGLGLAFLLGQISHFRSAVRREWFSLLTPATLAKALVVALALVVTLLPFGRKSENTEARALYLRANYQMRSGDLALARELFAKTLAFDPTYPLAHSNLGVTYFRAGLADSARIHFGLELSARPGQPDALTNLASLELSAGNLAAADSLSQAAYLTRPFDLTNVRLRIRLLTALGDGAALGVLLGATERRFSEDIRFWYEVGVAKLQLGEREQAERALLRGAELDPELSRGIEADDLGYGDPLAVRGELLSASAMIHYQLGFLSGIDGALDEAAGYSERAIALDSTLIPAYVNLGLALHGLGKVDSARAVYQRAQRIAAATGQPAAELSRLEAALGR